MKKFIIGFVVASMAFGAFSLTRMPVTASDYPSGEKAYTSFTIGNNPTTTVKKNFFTKTMYLCEDNGRCVVWLDKDGNVKKAQ